MTYMGVLPAGSASVSCRWTSQEPTPSSKNKSSKRSLAQGQGSSKRAKAAAALMEDNSDFDGLTAGLDGFFGKKQKQGPKGLTDNASTIRGVLKKVMLLLPGLKLPWLSPLPAHCSLKH